MAFNITLNNFKEKFTFENSKEVYNFFNKCKLLENNTLKDFKYDIINNLLKNIEIDNKNKIEVSFNGLSQNNKPFLSIGFKKFNKFEIDKYFKEGQKIKICNIEGIITHSWNKYLIIELNTFGEIISKVDNIYNNEYPSIESFITIIDYKDNKKFTS